MSRGKPITQHEINVAKALRSQGLSWTQVGIRMKRSAGSLRYRVRMGVKEAHTVDPTKVETLINHYQDKPASYFAALWGCSVKSVYYRATKLGLKKPRKPKGAKVAKKPVQTPVLAQQDWFSSIDIRGLRKLRQCLNSDSAMAN